MSSQKKIEQSNAALEYDFTTADLDDNLLGIQTAKTDLQGIINVIQDREEPPFVERYEELLDASMYIARLDVDEQLPLFSVRRISDSWTTKKVRSFTNAVFKDDILMDLEQQEVFRIDGKIDFLAFDKTIFIADKKNFEVALNFRAGMEKNRDEIVGELSELGLFEDPNAISALVGDNLPRLRKLSQAKKAGYYRDPGFLEGLKKINEEDGWRIQYSQDGKIIATEDNIKTLLYVLNNSRLTSRINGETFDADAKHKFSTDR